MAHMNTQYLSLPPKPPFLANWSSHNDLLSGCEIVVLLEPMLSPWKDAKCLLAEEGVTFGTSERGQRFTMHAWNS